MINFEFKHESQLDIDDTAHDQRLICCTHCDNNYDRCDSSTTNNSARLNMSSSGIHADPPPPIVTEPTGIDYATGPALGKGRTRRESGIKQHTNAILGGFAICHRAERYEDCKPTGQIVALKIVKTKMEPAKLAQKVNDNNVFC